MRFRLRNRFDEVDERQFHDEMLAIFNSLRDLHTCYVLPRPFRGRIAFLPFMVERCHVGDDVEFIVSKVHHSARTARFDTGVTVTHWNGVPIERVVELNARRRAGSNAGARLARGIDALTFRWLGKSTRPDEDWVTVHFTDERGAARITFPWRVALRPQGAPAEGAAGGSVSTGLDEENEWIRRVKRALFATDGEEPAGLTYPDAFRYRELRHGSGRYGYLRVFSFSVDSVPAFLRDAAQLLAQAPPDGLVLDVRGNGGGSIVAAERLLDLVAESVAPAVLQFLNTSTTERIASHAQFMAGDPRKEELCRSINMGRFTGSPFSRALPLELPDAAPAARVYEGPIVLVVDATSYSATDIFAAGFQDHAVGPLLGTSEQTGAGGANGWSYDTLRTYLFDGAANAFAALPHEASFNVAVRRAVRAGEMADTPLEDLGVRPLHTHTITRDDVLSDNRDLLDRAIAVLEDYKAAGEVAGPVRFDTIASWGHR